MFTRNFHVYMKNSLTNINDEKYKAVDGTGFSEAQISNMSSRYPYYSAIGNCMNYIKSGAPDAAESSSSYAGIYFGTGTTPASWDDIALESPLSHSLTCAAGRVMCVPDGDGRYLLYIDHKLTNNTDADVTINEAGIFGSACSSLKSNTPYYRPVLLERTVLDEPLVIPAGKSKLFTYKLVFNQT